LSAAQLNPEEAMRIRTSLLASGGAAVLLVLALAPSARAQEIFAGNLKIYYAKMPYEDGTFGARLTRAPEAGSPAAQIGLESGDIVFMLDNVRFREEADVLNHVDSTSVTVIDVQTNQVLTRVAMLPHQLVVNETTHKRGRPGWITQPQLRNLVREELGGGHVEYKPAGFTRKGNVLFWRLPEAYLNSLDAGPAVYAQFQVEIIRMTRTQPRQREFWAPYLERIESVIAELLEKGPALETAAGQIGGDGAGEENASPADDDRIQKIFEEAMEANAQAIGLTAQAEPLKYERGIYRVILATPGRQGRIFIMPRTAYRIRAFNPVALTNFQSLAPGSTASLTGEYVYMIRDGEGAGTLEPHTALPTFRAEQNGRIELK
jgi:hypothetical protein